MDPVSEVLACDDARLQAMVDGDIVALERLMGAEFFYTHRNGLTEGKQAYIDRLRQGVVRYRDPRRSEVVVQRFGDTVVMNGRIALTSELIKEGTRTVMDNKFMSVWVRAAGSW